MFSTCIISAVLVFATTTQAVESDPHKCNGGVNNPDIQVVEGVKAPVQQDLQRVRTALFQAEAPGAKETSRASCTRTTVVINGATIIQNGETQLPSFLVDPTSSTGQSIPTHHGSDQPVFIRQPIQWKDKVFLVYYGWSDKFGNSLLCQMSYESDDQAQYDDARLLIQC